MRKVFLVLIPVSMTIIMSSGIVSAQSDLVGYWKFDEGSGALATDSSDYGNDGTIIGDGDEWTTGKFGQALDLDGDVDYVNIPDSSSLDVTRITIESWIKINNAISPEWIQLPLGKSSAYYIGVLNDTTKIRFAFRDSTGAWQQMAGATSLTAGEWYHIAATYDGSLMKIYLNGDSDGTKSASGDIANSAYALSLGGYGTYRFNGVIDEVRIWKRALTANEIQSLYEAGYGAGYLFRVSGSLEDKNYQPMDGGITVYQEGSDTIVNSTQTSNGYYDLSLAPSTYDIRYDIPNIFIPNFFVRLNSIDIFSDLSNLIDYVTENPNEKRLSFMVDNEIAETIQTYSPDKPTNVLIDGTGLTEVASLSGLRGYTWYYDSNGNQIHVNISKVPGGGGLGLSGNIGWHYVGVWGKSEIQNDYPETKWIFASMPNEDWSGLDATIALNWYLVHDPEAPLNPFNSAEEFIQVETDLRTVDTANLWGTAFIGDEHYRHHIWRQTTGEGVPDDMPATPWFGETMMGWNVYKATTGLDVTKEEWCDEMYLRLIRGATEYWQSKGVKSGFWCGGGDLNEDQGVYWTEKGGYWTGFWTGIDWRYGQPAWDYMRQNIDFVMMYPWTMNPADYEDSIRYFDYIDANFPDQDKFLLLTQPWFWNDNYNVVWEEESMQLEMKEALDRGYIVTPYFLRDGPPDRPTVYHAMTKSIELYDQGATFYDDYAYGENLVTGEVGDTYGWVEVN